MDRIANEFMWSERSGGEIGERYQYVAWMIDNGRMHGVKHRREPRGVTE